MRLLTDSVLDTEQFHLEVIIMATIFENIKAISRISAGFALLSTSNACLVAGKETGIAARKVAGEHWSKLPGSNYNDRLLQAVISGKSPEPVPAPAASQTASAPAKGVSISPMVVWDKWHWVPSQLAEEEARKQGREAKLLYLYKGSNALINLAKYGKGDLRAVYKGRCYAEWICMAISAWAEYLRTKKGVTDAHSRLGQYYTQAAKRAFVACPNWEEVKAVAAEAKAARAASQPAQAPAKQAKPEPVPQPAPVPQAPPIVEENLAEEMAEELAMLHELPDAAPEPREGRAPATPAEPEEVVRKYDELRKVIGVTAVRANNAKGAAEKAAAAFKAGKINASEMRLFLEKAASKLPEGSDEAAAILAIA